MADKPLRVIFFKTSSGTSPVEDWLDSLPLKDQDIIEDDLNVLETGGDLDMPLFKPLGHGLWECRSNLTGKRKARTIFCLHDKKVYILDGFIKKTQKTPLNELNLARKRKREMGL